MIYLFAILSVMYASFEGAREAFYYHALNGVKSINIHWIYVVQRALFAGVLFAVTNYFILLFFICSFSFFHDGFYYYTRNKLNKNIYTKRFTDESTTSTAIFELNFPIRVVLLLFAVAFLILNFILK